MAFYDFPAEHWVHLRTTNPIESTFATVRLRTAKTRGCLSRQTMLTMVFKLCHSAEKRWHRKNRNQKQRWRAAALLEIEPRLRKIKGYRYLPLLQRTLQEHLNESRSAT